MLTLMSPIRQNVGTGKGQVSSFQESAGCILSVYDQFFHLQSWTILFILSKIVSERPVSNQSVQILTIIYTLLPDLPSTFPFIDAKILLACLWNPPHFV